MVSKPNIDIALVSRLIATQFPRWKKLAVRPVEFGGWDNRTFHLGDEMTVRLPSAAAYSLQVEKEHRWLPRLAPLLPLPIPVPLAMGVPAENYPWHWSVYRWIEGETAERERIASLPRFATDLAAFLVALQMIDATGGPASGQRNFFRGGARSVYDGETRQAIAALAAPWHGAPVWFHGDVSWGNLLVRQGRLGAVIDFGTSGVGDPACDLAIAWTLFEGKSREAFRAGLPADEAMWAWSWLDALEGADHGSWTDRRQPCRG